MVYQEMQDLQQLAGWSTLIKKKQWANLNLGVYYTWQEPNNQPCSSSLVSLCLEYMTGCVLLIAETCVEQTPSSTAGSFPDNVSTINIWRALKVSMSVLHCPVPHRGSTHSQVCVVWFAWFVRWHDIIIAVALEGTFTGDMVRLHLWNQYLVCLRRLYLEDWLEV